MLKRNSLGDLSGSNASATTSEALGVGAAATKLGIGAAAAGSSLASLAIPIIGVGLAALPFIINLAKCGTLTPVGCQKTSDSTQQIDFIVTGRQIVYAYESGQITQAQALQYLSQLQSEAANTSIWQLPTRSWVTPFDINICGGSGSNNGVPYQGVPSSSGAADVDCNVTETGPQFIADLAAYVQSGAGGASSINGVAVSGPQSVPAASNAAAEVGTDLIPYILLAAAAYFILG
jgi:hypothetical protein